MASYNSTDPRALRTREAFQGALIELLQKASYQKITVTDIARRAGFARHTFYNHFETKDDLLANLFDSVLDEFFINMEQRDFDLNDPDDELRMIASFFSVWRDHPDIVKIFNTLDLDDMLIRRLKTYFTQYYYDQVTQSIPGTSTALGIYLISFNAYMLLGLLKPWLQDEMRYPPEVMAEFLIQISGSSQRRQAVEKFKSIIK